MYKPFNTTIWSSIRQARDGKSTAVTDFVGKYRDPILSFIRRQGFTDDDAEDLCQEVFLLILKDDLLARAEQARGRFRSFLLGVTRNVVRNAHRTKSAEKRGGGASPLSLDAPTGGASTLADFIEGAPDESFDRDWIRHMVSLALKELARLHPRPHQVLTLHLEKHLSYADIARELGVDAKQVDNLLQQARTKLGEILRSEVAAYSATREEYEDEIACLKRYLAPARAKA